MPRSRWDTDHGRLGSDVGTFILFLCLSAFVPLLYRANIPVSSTSKSWLGGWLVCVIAGAGFSYTVRKGQPRLFALTYWIFVYTFLGLAPLVQQSWGINPDTMPILDHDLDFNAYVAVIIGVAAWQIGYASQESNDCHQAQLQYSKNRIAFMAALSTAVMVYYTTTVGISALFSSRFELDIARQIHWPDSSTRATVVGAAVFLPMVTVATMQCRGDSLPVNRVATWIKWVLITALLVLCNPVSSPRNLFGAMFLGLAAVFGAFKSSTRFRLLSCGLLTGLVVVFPYADYFRNPNRGSLVGKGSLTHTFLSGDYDAFAQLTNTLVYLRNEGSANGTQLLGSLLFWVPRRLWTGKPKDTGVLLGEYRGYHFTNLSAPLWAEFLVNASWIGLVIGMLLVGAWMARMDRHTTALPHPLSPVRAILPFYMLIVLRGSLLQATSALCLIILAERLLRSQPDPSKHVLRTPGRTRHSYQL